jgi:hypothetical protein
VAAAFGTGGFAAGCSVGLPALGLAVARACEAVDGLRTGLGLGAMFRIRPETRSAQRCRRQEARLHKRPTPYPELSRRQPTGDAPTAHLY